MTIEPRRLEIIAAAAEDGASGYNTLSSYQYCAMISELLYELDRYRILRVCLWEVLCPRDEVASKRVNDDKAIIDEVQALLEKMGWQRQAMEDADNRADELQKFQAELWGLLCPDSSPDDRQAIIDEVRALLAREADAVKAVRQAKTTYEIPDNYLTELTKAGETDQSFLEAGVAAREVRNRERLQEMIDNQSTKVGETDEVATAGGQDRGAARRAGVGDAGWHSAAGRGEGQAEAGQGAGGRAGQDEQRR